MQTFQELSDRDIQRLAAAMAPTVAAMVVEAMQPQLIKGDRNAAEKLGVSTSTLRRYRHNGTLKEMRDYQRVGEKLYQYNISRCRQSIAGAA